MYHVQLRQFPHNTCRFNLTEGQLRAAIVEPWAREQWIELGERKWNPHQATLTVLEGPELSLEQLAMSRGWRNAERHGQDVTERLLASVREADAVAAAAYAHGASAGGETTRLLVDSLALELLGALGAEPSPLRRAWELAQVANPGRAPHESLQMAEQAVGSLLGSGLLVVLTRGGAGADGGVVLDEPAREAALRALASWSDAGPTSVWIRRS